MPGFNNRVEPSYDIAELYRANIVFLRLGVIKESRFDTDGAPSEEGEPNWTNEDTDGQFRGPLYRVQFDEDGKSKTYWIPQLSVRAGRDQSYWPLEDGEQVLVAAVSGDPSQSFIIGAVFQNKYRPPVGWDDPTPDKRPWRETVARMRFADNTMVEYRRSDDKYSPDDARFLAVFLNDSSSFFQYEANPEKRKLTCRNREWLLQLEQFLLETDKTIELRGKKIVIEGDIEFQSGKNKISITKTGIEITGPQITIRDTTSSHGHG